MAQPSPYTPGQVAREVPGRLAQIADIDERLAYLIDLQRLVGRIRVDVAARGLGKTSLLREVQRRADARGALTVWVTAGEDVGLVPALGQEIARRSEGWASASRRHLRDALDRLTVTVGVPGVAQVEASLSGHRSHPMSEAREFERVLRETVASAKKEGHGGLVLLVDEIQAADPVGLRTLAYVWQHLQSEGEDVPVAVFAAGLPSSPETIANVVTFTERFAYRPLARLTPEASVIALSAPATALGVHWEPAALAAAAAEAQGYPYTLQLLGDAVWHAAGFPDPATVLTSAHLSVARRVVEADLTALFRARWEKATPLEQAFMKAMAAEIGPSVRRADIAENMGVDSDRLGVPRARLLDKGLIDVVGRGELEFSIPGFAEFVRAYTDSPTRSIAPEDRWADVCALIDPRILDDPHWPTLAARLDAFADTGLNVTALLRQVVADRPLDGQALARSLDYRLSDAASDTTALPRPWVSQPAPELGGQAPASGPGRDAPEGRPRGR